jgi:hypothetical protein
MKINSVAAAAVAWTILGVASACANPITYADFPSWSSSVVGQTAISIPNPVSPAGFDDLTAGANYGGVTFSSDLSQNNGGFFNIGPALSGSPAVLSAQQPDFNFVNVLVTLAGPVTGFSLNFDTFDGENVTFQLSNGDTFTLASTANLFQTTDFFGVTDDTPFNTVLITSGDEVLNLNNIDFGSAVSAIPESSTWAMLLMGFAGMTFLGRRRARRCSIGSV